MSADAVARGLAARARAAAGQRARVLMAAGQSGPIYGGSGAPPATVHSVTLPADTIPGGATLRLHILLAKYAPMNAGHSWRLRFGSVVVAQNTVTATQGMIAIEHLIHISHDRKAAFMLSRNGLNTASLAAGQVAHTGAAATNTAYLGARLRSDGAMFVANSAPPTAETMLVDLALPVTVALDVAPVNGDTVEVLGATLEMLANDPPVNSAGSRATVIWGDSLTEGSGSSVAGGLPMDVAAQLRRQRPGWPIAGMGLGGQKAQAIVDRLVADKVGGRWWNAVLWLGINDSGGDGAAWAQSLRAQVDRALSYRAAGGSDRTIVCTLHPAASWAVGSATYGALLAANAALRQSYGPRVCDLFAALATDGGKVPAANMADDIHLTNSGYTIAMQAIDARMTALGWN